MYGTNDPIKIRNTNIIFWNTKLTSETYFLTLKRNFQNTVKIWYYSKSQILKICKFSKYENMHIFFQNIKSQNIKIFKISNSVFNFFFNIKIWKYVVIFLSSHFFFRFHFYFIFWKCEGHLFWIIIISKT